LRPSSGTHAALAGICSASAGGITGALSIVRKAPSVCETGATLSLPVSSRTKILPSTFLDIVVKAGIGNLVTAVGIGWDRIIDRRSLVKHRVISLARRDGRILRRRLIRRKIPSLAVITDSSAVVAAAPASAIIAAGRSVGTTGLGYAATTTFCIATIIGF
jgi:hypothetical protein